MVQSLHDHKQEKLPSVATVADGIAVKEPARLPSKPAPTM